MRLAAGIFCILIGILLAVGIVPGGTWPGVGIAVAGVGLIV